MKLKYSRIVVIALMIVALLSIPLVSLASSEISPREITSATISFVKTSPTIAKFTVRSTALDLPTRTIIKVTLQSSTPGENKFSDVESKSKTTYDIRSSYFSGSFSITSDLDYRIKVEITDDCTGKDITFTRFKSLS